jgi:hypothetical protein
MILHVIWYGASVDAKQLIDYCRPYTIECNACSSQLHLSHFGKLTELIY